MAYSVGERDTLIFVVRPEAAEIVVKRQPVGAQALARQVAAFRRAIERHNPAERTTLGGLAADLYQQMLGSVEADIDTATRLLIVPDGPLHTMPFAALVRRGGQFLVRWKPTTVTVSATIQRELRRQRATNTTHEMALVAFADPSVVVGAPGARGPASARQLAATLADLTPLLNSRDEAA